MALRYERQAIYGDYARAGFGLSVSAAPLVLVPTNVWIGGFLAVLATLFALFAARTWVRHASSVVADDAGVAVAGPLPRRIAWADLEQVRLAYYSTRRDRTQGWMQLVLAGGGKRLALESTLDGFAGIAERAAAEAKARGLLLSPASIENFRALGVEGLEPAAESDTAAQGGAGPG
ncbi:MAG: hypothetical protein OHK0024_30620 [Thalassobaculales bacterium]